MFSKADAEAYFLGEKQESLLFMVLGIAAITAAVFILLYAKQLWLKGAAWPFLLIGLIQIAVGYSVFSRSDAQRKDIVYKMDMNPDALQKEELPRMQTVMRNFVWYRYIEIALAVAGLVLCLVFRARPDKAWWLGLAAGLTFQALLMLAADGFAENRGRKYLNGLTLFLQDKN